MKSIFKIHQSPMDFNGKPDPIHHQEDPESFIMNTHAGAGGQIPAVKVVEYMLSSMSTELLCKFPDNSAFDFDYTQSSIWSPLVPHPSNPSSPAADLQRQLSYDDDGEFAGAGAGNGMVSGTAAMKKLTVDIKDKIAGSCVFSCFKIHPKIGKKMMKRRRSSFRGFDKLGSISSDSSGVVADSGCSSPNQRKGWKKVLKAASKQFKKTMKKKESGVHLKLSNGFSHFSC